MEPAAFRCELRRRLCVLEAGADAWCPRCDAVLDRRSHPPGICVAGGERVLRHNALWSAPVSIRSLKRLAFCSLSAPVTPT